MRDTSIRNKYNRLIRKKQTCKGTDEIVTFRLKNTQKYQKKLTFANKENICHKVSKALTKINYSVSKQCLNLKINAF
jgi:hypothetical protein